MAEFVDDFEDAEAGLIDEEAIKEILEKAQDALRGLGLTIRLEDVTITIQQGQTYALIPALIRGSAKKKLKEDREGREAFNKMMAEQADAQINEEAEKIRALTQDPDALLKSLFGEPDPVEECEHRAPDGICIKCGAEVAI